MPRPEKPFDATIGQKILNSIPENKFASASELYKHVASEYNSQKSPNFPEVDFQLIRLRVEKGHITLPFAQPHGKRNKVNSTPMTEEHKKKLIEGRANKKVEKTSPTQDEAKWRARMTEEFSSQPNLLTGVLKGNRKAIGKAHCIMCVGGCIDNPGYQTAIKECKSFPCPRWIERPYK